MKVPLPPRLRKRVEELGLDVEMLVTEEVLRAAEALDTLVQELEAEPAFVGVQLNGFDTDHLTPGDCVYLGKDGKLHKTDAQNDYPFIGVFTGRRGSIQTAGHAKANFVEHSLSVGLPVYLASARDVSHAGTLTVTSPSNSGEYVARVGTLLDNAGVIFIHTHSVIQIP